MPASIPTAQLNRMRAQVLSTLPDTCILYRQTVANDGAGGATRGSVAVTGGTVACRLETRRSGRMDMLQVANGKIEQEYMVTLILPYDAPIAEHYLVAVTGGDVWQVIALDEGKSNVIVRTAVLERFD